MEGLVEACLNITSDDGLKLEPEGLNGVGDGTAREMGNQGTPDMGIRLGRAGSISAQQCAAQHPLELVRRPSIRARTEEIQTENAKAERLDLRQDSKTRHCPQKSPNDLAKIPSTGLKENLAGCNSTITGWL